MIIGARANSAKDKKIYCTPKVKIIPQSRRREQETSMWDTGTHMVRNSSFTLEVRNSCQKNLKIRFIH